MKNATEQIRIGTPDKPLAYSDWNKRRSGRAGRMAVKVAGGHTHPEAIFHSTFEYVKRKGQTVTALEADLQGTMSWMYDAFDPHGKPLLVDRGTWEKAKKLHVDAMAAANRSQPGCIYAQPEIHNWIKHQSRIAACALTAKERSAAAKVLHKVLIPQHWQTGRPLHMWEHVRAYRKCYRDVVAIRFASRKVGKNQIEHVYPETTSWPDTWKESVFYERGAIPPMEAAGIILADVLRADGMPLFAPDSFRKADSQWQEVSGPLRDKGKKRGELRLELCSV